MASKLEYLQRYMSSSAGAADAAGEKKLRKKKKKTSASSASGGSSASRFRVIDADHEWEQDAPSKDAIEHKWEQDAADEERPVVVADGEIVDPTDLPVYVNAEDYLDELNAKQRGAAKDDDLSPPRKSRESESSQAKKSSDEAKPRSRKYSSDGSPPRKAPAAGRERRQTDHDDDDDASPPRRRRDQAPSRRKADSGSENDTSPPRRSQPVRRSRKSDDDDSNGDASPPRRKPASRQSEEHFSGKRRSTANAAASDSDASLVRRPAAVAARKSPSKTKTRGDDASPPRRRSVKSEKPEEQRKEAAQPPQPRRTDSLGRDIPDRLAERMTTRMHLRQEEEMSLLATDPGPQVLEVVGVADCIRDIGRRGRHAHGEDPDEIKKSVDISRTASSSLALAIKKQSETPSRRLTLPLSCKTIFWSSLRDATISSSESPARSGRQAPHQERTRSPDRYSPPRKHQKRETVKDYTPRAASSKSEASSSKQADKTKDRKDDAEPQKARAGLFTAKEFAEEHKRKLRQNDFLRTADASDMGANAETVYRDKRGRKLDMLNEMVRQQEILDGKREREAREEYEWGTGKVQKQEFKSQRELAEQMKQAPFARHEDDPELEQLRKERVRAFDPMNSKVFQEDDLFGGVKSSKKSKSKKKSSTKPKYAGPPAPPNRFGIQPGYRWDGVVRGTGWEEKLLLRQNKQSAASEEAYRYAVADM
uniref:BUD13 homolog n=1 Tax=Globisporangium ultimum (strain ATCC 200006 / CBS 805.95 / DAOM BR144) TaxID=431595 RepID=K3WLA6_GLOUD